MWLVGFNNFWLNYSIRLLGTRYEVRIWKIWKRRLCPKRPVIEFVRWSQ